eukprot:gene7594-5355_t
MLAAPMAHQQVFSSSAEAEDDSGRSRNFCGPSLQEELIEEGRHGSHPRGCRYLLGGGAASSSDRGAGSGAAGGRRLGAKPLSIPQRPLVTVYTETGLFDEEEEEEEEGGGVGGGRLLRPDTSFATGGDVGGIGSASPMASPAMPLTSAGVGNEDHSAFSNANSSRMMPTLLSTTNPGGGSGGGAGEDLLQNIQDASFLTSSQACSFPTQIAPIVPYGDDASRRSIADRLERKAAEEERRIKQARAKSGGKTTSSDANLTRVQVVRVGIQRIKDRLKDLKLVIRRVKNDGNCQFRALSQQLLGTEECHDIVRYHVVSYMKRVRKEQFDCFFESTEAADRYFQRLSKLGSWGDELTLRGASDSLFINIYVISSEEQNFVIVYRPREDSPPAPRLPSMRVERIAVSQSCSMSQSFAMNGPSQIRPPLPRHVASQPLLSPMAASCPVFSQDASPTPPASGPLLRAQRPGPAGMGMGRGSPSPARDGSQPADVSSTRDAPVACSYDEATAAAAATGDPLEDDAALDVDVAALQNRLQNRLAKSTIQSGQPYFMRMGDAALGGSTNFSRSMVLTSSSPGGAPASVNERSVGSDMRKADCSGCGARSLDPGLLYTRRVEARKKGGGAGSGPTAAQDRFLAAGAERGSDVGNMSIRIFHPDNASSMDVPAPPLQRLLHPVAPGVPSSSGVAGSLQATEFGSKGTDKSSKLKSKKSKSRPPSPLQEPLLQVDDSHPSFPVFPHVEGVTNLTLHASRSVPIGGPSTSFTGNADSLPMIETGVSGTAMSLCDSATVPQFQFEAHNKPIDVFLSYLFPVHYNALAPDDGNFPNDPSKWFAALPADSAEAQTARERAHSPKYVSVPFLRPTTVPNSTVPSERSTPVPSRRNSTIIMATQKREIQTASINETVTVGRGGGGCSFGLVAWFRLSLFWLVASSGYHPRTPNLAI